MTQIDALDPFRHQIDEIDIKLISLLSERARVVQEVGKIKRAQGAAFYVPSREQAIYKRLMQLNPGPFPKKAIRSIFREIMSASLSLEEPVKVAYLGPRATFTHLACIQRFGSSVTDHSVNTITGVFDEIERGLADFGVVPIENSTEGVVNHTLDLFVDSPLKIFGEIFLEISHHLLSRAGNKESIRKIYSHSHAIAQCKSFLDANFPDIPLNEVSSTARAAELCQTDPEAGAIASELAAQIYQIPVIQKRIEDNPHNMTRFLVISKKMAEPSGRDKTSIIVSTRDEPGGLYALLRPFSDQKINLSKIESRPSKKKAWEYLFHIDMSGHVEDVPIRAVLDRLRPQTILLKVLGSYPVAEESAQ